MAKVLIHQSHENYEPEGLKLAASVGLATEKAQHDDYG